MVEEGSGDKLRINPKDIEDAEVLTKSAEIDIKEAEKTGADVSEAKGYLEEARAYLREFDIKQVRISVKKAKTAAADAKRFHRAELLIKHAVPVVVDARKAGADAQAAEEFIIKAREALNNRMYGEVSEQVRTAKQAAKEAKRYHRAYLLIENCKNDIANAKMAGANVAEAERFLDEARQALENKDYGVVNQHVKNAKNAATTLQKHMMVEELIAGVKPEIEELKRFGLQTDEIEGFLLEAETALSRRDYAEVRSLVRKIKRRVKKAMERKAANVLIANIDHVIQKAVASGHDVSQLKVLLERAKRAMERMNHTEIESIISELTSAAHSMGISISSLASDLFSKAKLVDLEKIDQVFSEAERKISAEMAKARITAMRDLLTSARHLGIEGTQFLELLKKAEEAFEARDYDIIEEYKESFEDRLEEAKLQHKTQIVGSKIMDVRGLIIQIKEQGIDVAESENLLEKAEQELNSHNFEKAEEHVKHAEKTAKERHHKHDISHELDSIKDMLTEAIESGVDVQEAKTLLAQAEDEINTQNFQKANELIELAKKTTTGIVSNFIAGKSPKFTVKLPEGGMEADTWNKCTVEIANTGNITAKNVDMKFKGDVETKGIRKIEKLDAGEKTRLEIGVMPKNAGDVDMEVLLTYQRVFDDTIYQLDLAKKIIADVTGTYLIDEVLLIHNSGILISRASRKLEADVDRDIFSGMFTAVQDFVKDSFRTTDDSGLKRMDFGTHKILIEHGHRIYIAAITVGGEPRYLPLYIVEVLREVEDKFGSVLKCGAGIIPRPKVWMRLLKNCCM